MGSFAEPRSFKDPPIMGEMTPIDLDGLNQKESLKVLQAAIVQVHSCVEGVGREVGEVKGELRGIALGLNLRKPEPGEEKPKAKTEASWQTKLAAAGSSVVAAAVLWQMLHAVWPALSQFLLSYHK